MEIKHENGYNALAKSPLEFLVPNCIYVEKKVKKPQWPKKKKCLDPVTDHHTGIFSSLNYL